MLPVDPDVARERFSPPAITERPVQTLRYSRSLLHRHGFLGPRPLMPRIGRMSGFACVRRGSGNEVADLLPECGRQGAAAKRRWEHLVEGSAVSVTVPMRISGAVLQDGCYLGGSAIEGIQH